MFASVSATGLQHCDVAQADLMPVLLPTKARTLAHSTQNVTKARCTVVMGLGFGLGFGCLKVLSMSL